MVSELTKGEAWEEALQRTAVEGREAVGEVEACLGPGREGEQCTESIALDTVSKHITSHKQFRVEY